MAEEKKIMPLDVIHVVRLYLDPISSVILLRLLHVKQIHLDTLKEKVRLSTILGTFQSTLTDLNILRKVWKDNTEEERLLGVSLTGILDCYLAIS